MKNKISSTCMVVCLCMILVCPTILNCNNSYAKPLGMEYKNNKLSADLKAAPLQKVFDYLNKKKGIWIEGEKEVPGKKISIKFDKLSLVDGIRRLLTSIDYALVFDRKGELIGVVIINGETKKNDASKAITNKNNTIMPPMGDNTLPPIGQNTLPPPATQLPPVPKGDVMMPPPAKMLPPQVSKKVLEIMKKSDKMPPVSGNLPE